MLMKVFSVRDMKAEAFLQPFFTPTQGSALRAFGDACNKTDSPFYAHPNDYVLYEIGSYNDADANLVALTPIKMMACAADFVVKVHPTGVDALKASGNRELVEAVAKAENHGS